MIQDWSLGSWQAPHSQLLYHMSLGSWHEVLPWAKMMPAASLEGKPLK
jgi:hypothetical protein